MDMMTTVRALAKMSDLPMRDTRQCSDRANDSVQTMRFPNLLMETFCKVLFHQVEVIHLPNAFGPCIAEEVGKLAIA
jgi:hypothetical protein